MPPELERLFECWTRPGGEATGPLDQHGRGVTPRRLEREPVLGVAGRGPELVAALVRSPAGVAKGEQRVPVALGAEPFDGPQQLVEVAGGERLPDRGRDHPSGK